MKEAICNKYGQVIIIEKRTTEISKQTILERFETPSRRKRDQLNK